MSDSNALIQSLIKRIDELESRTAIRDLVSDYCLGFDNHDWDRFVSIWHHDAVWEIGPPFGTFEAHAGIRHAVFDILYPFWRESHHLATNLRIAFSDPDHAHGVCNVDCMGASVDNVVQMVGATYTDDFERRDGCWKILKRAVTIHFFNPMPGLQMSAPA